MTAAERSLRTECCELWICLRDLLLLLLLFYPFLAFVAGVALIGLGAVDLNNGLRVPGVAKLAAAGALMLVAISPGLVYCRWEPRKAPCSTEVDPQDGRAAHCCCFRRSVTLKKARHTPGIVAALLCLTGLGLLALLKEATDTGGVPKKQFLAVLAVSLPLLAFTASLTVRWAPSPALATPHRAVGPTRASPMTTQSARTTRSTTPRCRTQRSLGPQRTGRWRCLRLRATTATARQPRPTRCGPPPWGWACASACTPPRQLQLQLQWRSRSARLTAGQCLH